MAEKSTAASTMDAKKDESLFKFKEWMRANGMSQEFGM
jgi:hypothetical protein